MGYRSRVFGEISFDPPMTHEEVQAIEPPQPKTYPIFQFRIFETEEPVMGGVLKSSGSCAMECVYEDEIKAYTVTEDLNYLIKQIPGRKFSGEFRIEGEENLDIRRVFIDDNAKVVEWTPTVTWPDGQTERGEDDVRKYSISDRGQLACLVGSSDSGQSI